MTEEHIPGQLLAILQATDTPTVCNAIEVAEGRRGFDRFTIGTMQHSQPTGSPMVGFARTAKIAGRSPPAEEPSVISARRKEYYRAMAAGPRPAIAVTEDTDFPDCVAGWWGEVHAAVHKGLGLTGAITNGVMRDLDTMDEGFPVLAGSIGVSHGFVHVVDIGATVNIFGLTVSEGDLVHADRHGALVVPERVLPDLEEAINSIIANEAIILDPARETCFDIDKLEAAWAQFEARRI